MTRWGFSGELAHSLYIYCRLPGVESTDETVKLSHYVSAVSVFAVARPVDAVETVRPLSQLPLPAPLAQGSQWDAAAWSGAIASSV